MHIGVFGDSFADKNGKDIWWRYLAQFGHEVTSFGEGGSSLAFSAGLLWTHADEFEFNIWCVTSSNRVSFYHNDQGCHVTNAFDFESNDDTAELRNIAKQYLTKVYHAHGNESLGNLAITGALHHFQNLLIIPCFATPWYFMRTPGFNLFELSTLEAQYYFPNLDLYSILSKYRDIRSGHLTPDTGKLLAKMINQTITSRDKVFDTNYQKFPPPTVPLSEVFQRHDF